MRIRDLPPLGRVTGCPNWTDPVTPNPYLREEDGPRQGEEALERSAERDLPKPGDLERLLPLGDLDCVRPLYGRG